MKKTLRSLLAAFMIAAMLFSALSFVSVHGGVNAAGKSAASEETVRVRQTDPDEIVPIIVKLEDEPVLARTKAGEAHSAEMSRELIEKQNKVIASINEKLDLKSRLEPAYQYTLVFNGFSFRGEHRLIEEIAKLPGVKACYRSNTFEVPEDVKSDHEQSKLGTSVGWINADDMWALGYTGQGQTIAVIDTGIKKDHPNFAAAPVSPHFAASDIQTILDNNELCAEQRYSAGTLTGSLLYHSAKIPYTYNYYSGNLDVSHADARSDHGTHVSSICAGNDNSARGVAYNAQIISMQVFSNGSGDWIDILAALEDCAYLEVDALNMSLGADCGFTDGDEDMDRTFALLAEHGVNAAVAAGNSGVAGSGNDYNGITPTVNIDNGVVSTPGVAAGALCVAASSDSAAAVVTGFSSRGTTSNLRIKPEIMAPGENINAATDSSYSYSNYGTKSGTSMACPHIAGGMVLVNQYINENFPNLNEMQRMNLANSLLMSTAVPSRSGNVYISPRAQGAGQADLTAAIGTKAYIEVPGSLRPKIELGDDDEKNGVFTLTFEVVNFGASPLTYNLDVKVLTEDTVQRSVGGRQTYTMRGTALDITNNANITKPATVNVPANGRTSVTVTIDVSGYGEQLDQRFPSGAYIEGFVMLDGEVDLSLPYLGFYGDWEKAPVFDSEFYYDQYLHTNDFTAAWGVNTAGASAGANVVNFGVNPFMATTNFSFDRSSISPNGDGMMDAIDTIKTHLLRNVEIFRYEIVDAESGEQYYVKDVEWQIKGVENGWQTHYEPVGSYAEDSIDPWDGAELPNGTTVTLRVTGLMQAWDEFDPLANDRAIYEIPVTIDYEEPQVVYWELSGGQLTITVEDNHYTAFVGVYADAACTSLITQRSVEENERGARTTLSFNVGNRSTVYVKLGDYAYNVTVREITEGQGGSMQPVALTGVSLDTDGIEVYEGFFGELHLVCEPAEANDFDVVWTSANEQIASIRDGRTKAIIKGVQEGATTVTATVTDRSTGASYTASANVTVLHYPTLNEALNVQGGNLNFTSEGSYPWIIDMGTDRLSVKSTNQGVNSSSSTVTTDQMTLHEGDKLTFEWTVSSEENYDKLKFYVNGSLRTDINGSVGWTRYEYTVPSNGTYTFRWSYEKDSSVNGGSDTAMLDEVEMTYVTPPYILGDCNLDGSVEAADAILALRHALGILQLSGNAALAGDVTFDGSIAADDAVLILRFSLGLIDQF